MKVIILAGGSGTRLWPLSRERYPKQFLKLYNNRSLLQQTKDRLMGLVPDEDIIIMTKNDYKFHVAAELGALPFHLILEPESRNTAPAIALGVKYCLERLSCKEDEVIFVLPSDHIIGSPDIFREKIRRAEGLAKKGYLVTFGIRPARPETGYGYIKAGGRVEGVGSLDPGPSTLDPVYKVEIFTEKPDIKSAERYLKEGCFYWNSGIFAFRLGTILDEFQRHTPGIGKILEMGLDEVISNFAKMPNISIDYAVMERSNRLVMLPLELGWNDIGSWDSLYDLLDKDAMGNVKKGDVLSIDTKESLIIGNRRLISTIGLEDCLIVETDDAVLIAKRGYAQRVSELVERLKEGKRKEVSEHATTFRPWGNYTILEEGERYKIKRIVVNTGESLSLQLHHHRSEHWVAVKGTAKVKIGDKELFIHENESAYVPKSTLHQLENPGKTPLEIIEIGNGEYLGEDDIIRYKDDYGRVEGKRKDEV